MPEHALERAQRLAEAVLARLAVVSVRAVLGVGLAVAELVRAALGLRVAGLFGFLSLGRFGGLEAEFAHAAVLGRGHLGHGAKGGGAGGHDFGDDHGPNAAHDGGAVINERWRGGFDLGEREL